MQYSLNCGLLKPTAKECIKNTLPNRPAMEKEDHKLTFI